MAKINILPSKVYNRIAAGEVVDRPYSVVKELVENSIDAGATEIEIYIEQGGKQLIRVVDNGCGIEREDLHSAFLPHATSKIAKAEDLENIMTLGFRGEAVASIASVSKMTIKSKTKDGKCYSLNSDGGELGQICEAAGEDGTDVSVEMLFFNAPVRLNFLKSDKAEETEITNFISRFILNRSDISFTYYADGKKILQSFGGGDEEALVSVYGAATLRECFQINAEKHGVRIRGYIGNQNFYKANKSYQSVFLNGRYIINATVCAAISNAYSSYLMKRQHPFYVLHVDVPSGIVDVNVHPNKADVRFADNQIIYGCIYSVISAVLDGHTKALDYIVKGVSADEESQPEGTSVQETIKKEPTPAALPKSDKSFGFATLTYEQAQRELRECTPIFSMNKKTGNLPFDEVESKPKSFVSQEELMPYPLTFARKEKPEEKAAGEKHGAEKLHESYPDLYFKKVDLKVEHDEKTDYFEENKRFLEKLERKMRQDEMDIRSCKYAGKLFNTYLLYESTKEVYIIDQHAAHERLIYDRLKEKMKNRTIVQQPMLISQEMELNAFERTFIREHLSEIRDIGFEIEECDEGVSVTAVPLDLQDIDLRKFFHEILAEINNFRAIKLEEILKDKLAMAACKAAVRGGMDLTEEEIDALFEMMDGDMGLKCPHGRPVVVKMTRVALEKMFKRIV